MLLSHPLRTEPREAVPPFRQVVCQMRLKPLEQAIPPRARLAHIHQIIFGIKRVDAALKPEVDRDTFRTAGRSAEQRSRIVLAAPEHSVFVPEETIRSNHNASR